MSTRKDIAEKYIEGFRRSDHGQILSYLTDDVVWGAPRLLDHLEAEVERDRCSR